MKNILFILFSLAWISSTHAQAYSNWEDINSSHNPIKHLTHLGGQLLTTNNYKLWHSPDQGASWLLVDYPIGYTPPPYGLAQRVYMNKNGVVVSRKTGYPGFAYISAWNSNSDSLKIFNTFTINSNGYDFSMDTWINNDQDEFILKYSRHDPNMPTYDFCSAYHSYSGASWTNSSCDNKLIPDTLPSYFIKHDSLFELFTGISESLAPTPDFLLGKIVLTSSIIKQDTFFLGFANGQIAKSFDHGLNWDTCAYMTPKNPITHFRKDDYGIYFNSKFRIDSPTKYSYTNSYYATEFFKHKGKDFRKESYHLSVFNPDIDDWEPVYNFPKSKIAKTENELFFYGQKNSTNFIFRSIDAGQQWQIYTAPSIISTLVAAKNQWFIHDKENHTIKLSNDLGQSWTDISVDTQVDTIYTYKNQVFLVGANSYYSWNRQNASWILHDFTYTSYPITNLYLDEFLLFTRETQGDSTFYIHVTDLANNESRNVILPDDFEIKEGYWGEWEKGATDYMLHQGKLYICDAYNNLGIKYSNCEPNTDTMFIQAEFCPEMGIVLGDTTLYQASTDTIHFLDHFHTPSTAILDISPFETTPMTTRDTTINYGDKIFNQQIFSDTLFNQVFNNQFGCDSIIQWNVATIVSSYNPTTPQISISPNPSLGNITIAANEPISGIQLNVVNILGQIVHHQIVSSNTKIDLVALPKGVYHLVFQKNNWQKSLQWVKL